MQKTDALGTDPETSLGSGESLEFAELIRFVRLLPGMEQWSYYY